MFKNYFFIFSSLIGFSLSLYCMQKSGTSFTLPENNTTLTHFNTFKVPLMYEKTASVEFIYGSHDFFLMPHPLQRFNISGKKIRQMNTTGYSFSTSPDSQYFALIPLNRNALTISLFSSLKPYWEIPVEDDRLEHIVFSIDNTYAAMEFSSHKIKIYDLKTKTVARELKVIERIIRGKNPCEEDYTYYMCTNKAGLISGFISHYFFVFLSFSPRNTYFATGTYEGGLFLWKTNNWQAFNSYQIYDTFPTIAWSNNETLIAISDMKKSITIANIESTTKNIGTNYAKISLENFLRYFTFTHNDNLITVTENYEITLWNKPDYTTRTIIMEQDPAKRVISASLSSNNTYLIILYKNNTEYFIDVWKVAF
ncbi:MAG TPA: WD40 repeat domain-containing protein [Candidatus Bathyarchaeia archaeon]|nr:WD40 repeat domain-containing protein [Candidatus Bathyarchaeia archaeon]